jgi:3-methyladenine DNA glycosylase AlkD
MPFLGVSMPVLRSVCREVFAAHPLEGFEAWRSGVLALWRPARYREERYAAIELTGHRLYRSHQTPAALPLYEELIVTGAWWDYVDAVATRRLGALLRSHRAAMTPAMLEWSRSHDRWKRRASIICQVTAKTETDVDLLLACIDANLDDPDFFLRKAIGWALRSYARTDPDTVARYVATVGDRMSALSRREALKHIA